MDKNYQWYLVNLHSDKTDYVNSRQVSKNKIILLSIHWCRCVMPKRLMAILIIRTVCTKRYDCTEMHYDNCHALSYTDTKLFFNELFILYVSPFLTPL